MAKTEKLWRGIPTVFHFARFACLASSASGDWHPGQPWIWQLGQRQDLKINLSLKWEQKSRYNEFNYNDVIMGAKASQITSLTIVYLTVYSDADQRKHQSSASLAFAWEIHRGPVNSPHKWPVTQKMFPFDDVIIFLINQHSHDQGNDHQGLVPDEYAFNVKNDIALCQPWNC